MSVPLLNDRDLEFLLYELLDIEALLTRPRYRDHTREVFDASLRTAKTVAEKYFADHLVKGDENEPTLEDGEVQMIPETRVAWQEFTRAGFLAAHQDYDEGGMQMPEVLVRVIMAYINAANISTAAYPFIAIGVTNLLRAFASTEQKAKYLPLIMDGRSNGTMALTEPGQGSALGDITTMAEPAADGTYRLFGQKMFISCADHNIADNVIHMVLAKIKGSPAGVKGISLFIVPKYLVNEDGSPGARNDVVVAGLNHKMGYRNATNAALNFGEEDGAIAYLVGEANKGLGYMFQMMNEARIGVALGAAALAYQGYNYSLDYARQRPQGRLASCKDPQSAQIMLVEHADVRRMLLAQKAYAEGSLAMCLYASSLFEDQNTAADESKRERARQLLDLIIPVVKSWPSKYGCVSNDLAIQILGGSGYIREYPVEQLYRDQRLNPIHEGAEAIHGLDLLGRKVPMRDKTGFSIFIEEVNSDLILAAEAGVDEDLIENIDSALKLLCKTTDILLDEMNKDIDKGLANATMYLDMFGRIVAAWIWLKMASKAAPQINMDCGESDNAFYRGKLQAARYYIEWELPAVRELADLLMSANLVPFDMQDEWF
ncbi:MAG: acyl-CoA dehydrogenase [Gammaproteobacteria bacterium]|nr:MAG: acyl-CoA dehydrogenase [Gammaproteobacteria bacterium]